MATTVYIPMALSTVNLGDANAYWTAVDGTNFDYGVYAFVAASTGTLTFECLIPQNLAATPAWDVALYGMQASGTAGTVAITAAAAAYANGETYDVSLTSIAWTKATTVNAVTTVTVGLLNGGSLDGTVSLAAADKLVLQISRGGTAGTDTSSATYYLLGAPVLKVDVT